MISAERSLDSSSMIKTEHFIVRRAFPESASKPGPEVNRGNPVQLPVRLGDLEHDPLGQTGGALKGGWRFVRKLRAKTLRNGVQYLPYRMADPVSDVIYGECLKRTHRHFAHSPNVVEMDIVSNIVGIAEDPQRSVMIMKHVIDRHASSLP